MANDQGSPTTHSIFTESFPITLILVQPLFVPNDHSLSLNCSVEWAWLPVSFVLQLCSQHECHKLPYGPPEVHLWLTCCPPEASQCLQVKGLARVIRVQTLSNYAMSDEWMGDGQICKSRVCLESIYVRSISWICPLRWTLDKVWANLGQIWGHHFLRAPKFQDILGNTVINYIDTSG